MTSGAPTRGGPRDATVPLHEIAVGGREVATAEPRSLAGDAERRGDFLAAESRPSPSLLAAPREPLIRRLGRLAMQAALPAVVLYGAWQLTAALVGGTGAPGGAAPTPPETVYAVTAVDVEPALNHAIFRAFGEVVAANIAELRMGSAGEVVAMADKLAVGEVVEAGTPLVTVDPFAYEGALREARAQLAESRARLDEAGARIGIQEAVVANALAQLQVANRDLERAERLASTGTITEQALDERRLLASERTAALDQARFSLAAEQARQAQEAAAVDRLAWAEERAERALADTVLRAPFRGIVREENVALGRILSVSDMAVSLVRADALDVRFVLSDARYGRLARSGSLPGTEVDVTWRIGDTPLRYTGIISRVGADIAADSGGIDVYARLVLPADGVVPRPGAFVEVALAGPPHPGSFRVPAAALYGDHVFVIDADDRLAERAVTLLAIDDGEAILGGRLAAGDRVVTTRLAGAGNGLKVRRVVVDGEPSSDDAEPS